MWKYFGPLIRYLHRRSQHELSLTQTTATEREGQRLGARAAELVRVVASEQEQEWFGI